MVVNQITAESNAFGRGYAYGRVVSVSMTARDWNMICQSPCEFTVAPGTIALVFNGEGAMPAEEHVSLVSGDNYIHVSPGSRALRNVQLLTGVFGIIALTFGGTLLLLSYARDEEDKVDKNYLKYGVGLSAAGGGLIVGSWVLSSFTETEVKWGPGTGPGAPPTSNKSGRVGLSLRSAF
jgi:hypothetical protein